LLQHALPRKLKIVIVETTGPLGESKRGEQCGKGGRPFSL